LIWTSKIIKDFQLILVGEKLAFDKRASLVVTEFKEQKKNAQADKDIS